MGNEKIRKWDEIKGMPVEGYEKRMNRMRLLMENRSSAEIL